MGGGGRGPALKLAPLQEAVKMRRKKPLGERTVISTIKYESDARRVTATRNIGSLYGKKKSLLVYERGGGKDHFVAKMAPSGSTELI